MLSVRIEDEKKERLEKCAKRLGYKNTSEFVLDVLDALMTPNAGEGYECRMIHIDGNRIVNTGPVREASPTPSFPVTASEEFWRAIEQGNRVK